MTLRMAIVGTGWRSEFFLRVAAALPERFEVVGVVSRSRSVEVAARWGVPSSDSLDDILRNHPGVVVTSVPWTVTGPLTRELVGRRLWVLSETPPAATLAEMRALWSDVGDSGLVQVAEQNVFIPIHQARLRLTAQGALGQISHVAVSSTHDYHAVALIRAYLGVDVADCTVSALELTTPLITSLHRDGWPDSLAVEPATHTLATLEFGGAIGQYDFTEGQWFHPLRRRRHVIRGSHGEIVDDLVTVMADPSTPVSSRIVRRERGVDGDLEGLGLASLSLGSEVLWRNQFSTGHGDVRLSDEDFALADLLAQTAAWVDGGEPPYPLAQACQDHAIGLAIHESAARGERVQVAGEPWAHD